MGIFSFLGRKKPKRVEVRTLGHRGIAAGSLKPGEQDLSAENVEKWKMLGADEVADFVYRAQPLFVHSTYMVMGQYFIEEKKFLIEYPDGEIWAYDPVTEEMAIQFAQAQSKGGWVYDHIRVRGKGNIHNHQMNAVQVSGGTTPKLRSQATPRGRLRSNWKGGV